MKEFLISILIFFLGIGCRDHTSSSKMLSEEEYEFLTIDNKPLSFQNITDSITNVLIFLSPDCPIAQKYSLILEKLYQEHHQNRMAFYGIFPSYLGEKASAGSYAQDFNLSFPLIRDYKSHLLKHFAATISPEVFIIDQNAMVLYQGKIDNWFFTLGKKRSVVTEHYLSDALAAINTKKEIKVKKTKAVGCYLPKID